MSFFKKIFEAFTRKEKIIFISAIAICIISLGIILGITIAQTTKAVPAAGGEFTEGVIGQPEYVNPVIARSETDIDLVKLIYTSINAAAASITSSPDGKTWTVRLKEGITWQDGQKLTSDDVIFTVQAVQDPDANSPLATTWQGVAVTRTSELEVQFSLPSPNAFFPDDLKNLYILPKHIFADVPPGNWHLSDYDLKPIGSGPYKFVAYDQQSNGFISDYKLSAWNGYSGPEPLIQNFNFSFFSNENDLVKNFNTAQIDGFAAMSGDLANIGRPYNLSSWQTSAYYAVFWNQSTNLALQDPIVRSVLNTSIDRQALVKDALEGNGSPDYGPVPPAAPYAINMTASTSLETASETLTADGWIVQADGSRVKSIKKSSTTLAFALTVPDIDFLVKTADDLQAAWQSIGVQMTISTDTPENIATNEIPNRDYDAILFGNVLGPSSDLQAFWDSSERFSPGLNLAIYDDPAADALIASIPQTMDNSSRAQMFATLQTTIMNDDPAVFLYSPNYLYAANKAVQGITSGFLSDPSDRFLTVPSWYLNTTRVLK